MGSGFPSNGNPIQTRISRKAVLRNAAMVAPTSGASSVIAMAEFPTAPRQGAGLSLQEAHRLSSNCLRCKRAFSFSAKGPFLANSVASVQRLKTHFPGNGSVGGHKPANALCPRKARHQT